MRSPANRRRSLRNRNRQQPSTSPNQNSNPTIPFTPKLKYRNSRRDANGVLFLSKRKRALPTEAELEARKAKKIVIKTKHIYKSALQHQVIGLYENGCNKNDQWRFGPRSSANIVQFLQAHFPHLREKAAAQSFFYRALKKAKSAATTPHLDPFRERRGENKTKSKRENPQIVELCDELLSEPKATAPKVKLGLRDNGHDISLSTIYRIAKDLLFRWQKPWHTDVLTTAQKYKRKLYCAGLLRLSEEALLRKLMEWMWTDEKWWDLVGPVAYKYVKVTTNMEAKLQNQVIFFYFILLALITNLHTFFCHCAATP